MDIYLARQPIFNRKKQLYGYEILYRGDVNNYFPQNTDGEVATSTVLAHTLFNIGLEGVTNGKKALINFTEKHLLAGTPSQLPKEHCIVEILEDVAPTDAVLAACKALKTAGYLLALDDYIFDFAHAPLLDLVDIIKIDCQAISVEKIRDKLKYFTPHYPLELLAEKIESHEEFEQCHDMGFDYFQGFFFSKPEIIKKQKLDITKVTLLALIAEVNRADFSFSRVERMIAPDVALSYKLLRYINSAYYSLVSKVKSIRHALAYLGEAGTCQFVCLAVASELAVEKTPELTKHSIIRAQLCKLLAQKSSGGYDESQLFLVGLFSMLDAMLNMPMQELLVKMSLAKDLNKALGEREGPLAPFLLAVEAYEHGNINTCVKQLALIGVTPEEMVNLYFKALRWADLLNA